MAISKASAVFRKAAFAFALCAASAFAATYKDFYTVEDWKDPELTGTAYCVDPYGKMSALTYKLVPDGNGQYNSIITDPGGQDFNSTYWTAIQASIAAAEAMAEAKLAQAQIDKFALRHAPLDIKDALIMPDPSGVLHVIPNGAAREEYDTWTCVRLGNEKPRYVPCKAGCCVSVDHGAYCGRAKRQCGDECAAYAVASYLEALRRFDGTCAVVDADRMHGRAAERWRRQGGAGDVSRARDCFEFWLEESKDRREVATVAIGFGHQAERADKMRYLVSSLLSRFGVFVANVETTDEWQLLNSELAQFCEAYFGRRLDAITGLPHKITSFDGKQSHGGHCVVVYGCDEEFVYFLNTWGEGWGDRGRGKIVWGEFAKQLKSAQFLTDRKGIDEWVSDISSGGKDWSRAMSDEVRRQRRGHADGIPAAGQRTGHHRRGRPHVRGRLRVDLCVPTSARSPSLGARA